LRDNNVITSKPTNDIKIDPYDFELYGFKVGAFFVRLCSLCVYKVRMCNKHNKMKQEAKLSLG